ncbi:ImmA/IrrE family metallo-endopeptidase [Mesorhizobium sp. M0910]|uniref:ImmA/IrrE family metallo-endopeptidase n=1 Tax=Mesorhizobium sp. M0910 TaxID=2957025 RepID=UPI003338C121
MIESGGQVDIFEAIDELDIALIFKPLTSALGFCLPAPMRGIMVTTLRGLHIQRFTAAHELGHVILEHTGSIDKEQEILARDPFSGNKGDLPEIQAEAFAAEFLLPRWLYFHHAKTQGWTTGHLRNPDVVYQLSLRMGASYSATCWGLAGHQILDRAEVEILTRSKVAQLKTTAGKSFRPGDSWADVWRLTRKDSGSSVSGNPDDLIRFDLDEMVDGGYQWDLSDLRHAGYEVLADESTFSRDPLLYGAPAQRTVIARPPGRGATQIRLQERQATDEATDGDPELQLRLVLEGKEDSGLSRVERRRRGIGP